VHVHRQQGDERAASADLGGGQQRARGVNRVLWIVLALNLGVAALKLVFGFLTGSLSMIADGFHSSLDASSNVVGLAGMWLALRAPDQGHPYGHRKFEALAALLISLFLFLACYEILTSLVGRLQGTHEVDATPYAFLVMVGTIAVNIGITRYEARAATRLRSMILAADAKHTRSDVFVGFGVLASLLGARLGFPSLDLVVAVVIVGLIAYSGYQIVRDSFTVLVDGRVLDPEHVTRVAMGVAGVSAVHRVRSRGVADDIQIDLHVHVPGQMSVSQAHELAHEISARIRAEISGVTDVVVHVEPDDVHHE
jgi:cation diffusion facilitator family transporter